MFDWVLNIPLVQYIPKNLENVFGYKKNPKNLQQVLLKQK